MLTVTPAVLLSILVFSSFIYSYNISLDEIDQFEKDALAEISNQPMSPLQQFQLGIPAKYVNCVEGLQLVIKSTTGTPACLKWGDGKKLLKRGWAKSAPMISNYVCDSDCKQKLEKQGYTCYEAAKESNFCTDKFSQRISGIVIPYSANSPDGKNYVPNAVTVSIGINNTVRWTNADITPHTIVSDKRGFSSSTILPNQTWTFTFDKPGEYEYHGEPGPWLHGKITVLPVDMEFDKGRPIEDWGGEPSLGRYIFRETDSLGYVDKVLVLDDNSVMISLSYPNGTEKKRIDLKDEFVGVCSKYNDFTTVKTFVLERIDKEQKIAQFREELELTNKTCNELFD
ncbi:MAG: cupredoxin domain-containing protein [Thaumarchaeota archaeon]|nr:cupredoxin domain-containing protein [Nitrososphaerota archaeon]